MPGGEAPLRVAVCGLGPIGREIARRAHERGHRLVALIDISPDLAGRPAAEVLGHPELDGPPVSTDADAALAAGEPDVAVVATVSRIEAVAPQLLACLKRGIDVVSTSEELTNPPERARNTVAEIDGTARRHAATVVATGINPGFLMDTLPLTLTAPCLRVDRIRVRRVLDAAARRQPFQDKIGLGLSRTEFDERSDRLGHVGLEESARMIADYLGWRVDRLDTAKRPLDRDGVVRGVVQSAVVISDGSPVVELIFEATSDAAEPRDEVEVQGNPGFTMTIVPGIDGDAATVAMVVNALPAVASAPPGLLRMPDLTKVHR